MKTIPYSWRYIITAFVCVIQLCSFTPLLAQVKIGTNPTTIGGNSNLLVEAAKR